MSQKTILKILAFITAMALMAGLLGSCTKEAIGQPVPQCEAVTYIFKSTGDTIIHWHKVCGEDLTRFKSYPKESEVLPGCDSRIQVLIIGKDNCKY